MESFTRFLHVAASLLSDLREVVFHLSFGSYQHGLFVRARLSLSMFYCLCLPMRLLNGGNGRKLCSTMYPSERRNVLG